MYRYVIVESEKGYVVYVNLIASSAGTYLSRQPYVIGLIKEVLEPMVINGTKLTIEHDMGRVIGNTDIVETSSKDTVYYAQPHKKAVYSRYVKNRQPLPSSVLSIILHKDEEGNFELLDTWIGPYSPPFPGDDLATSKSKLFWENHALIQDSQVVQTKTITKVCPY
jgi:hypothetical protein